MVGYLVGWFGKQVSAGRARFALDIPYCNAITTTATGLAPKRINLIYLLGKLRHMAIW
jgi:hypothetical protein